jgi:small subunit ribosomal protein S20
MPIIESAKKALRQSKKRRIANLQKANSYKTVMKKIERLVKDGKKDEATKLTAKAYKAVDKAAKVGVIKKNKASRLKSKTARMVSSK